MAPQHMAQALDKRAILLCYRRRRQALASFVQTLTIDDVQRRTAATVVGPGLPARWILPASPHCAFNILLGRSLQLLAAMGALRSPHLRCALHLPMDRRAT
jgi:hypothetical protein